MIYVFVLGPLTVRTRYCNEVPARELTQECFTEAHFLIKSMHSEVLTALRNIGADWDTIRGKGCSCFNDRCNNMLFRELSVIPLNSAPTVEGVPTSTTAMYTTTNNEGNWSSSASDVGLTTSDVGLTTIMNVTVDQTQQNFGNNEESTASPTSSHRGITDGHISTRATDNKVLTTGQNKNDKPVIKLWLLPLCFVITLLF